MFWFFFDGYDVIFRVLKRRIEKLLYNDNILDVIILNSLNKIFS